MRVVLAGSALLLTVGAITPPSAGGLHARPQLHQGKSAETSNSRACRDRIEAVRQERGLPKLDNRNVSTDEPLLIAAVDKRIDGCSVLVMRDDINDIRPLPQSDNAPAFRPVK